MINFKKFLSLRYLLLLCFILLIITNVINLSKETLAQIKRSSQQQLEPGFEFEGLKESLKNIPIVGYLSEKDQSSEGNDGRFMMAQYMLAPTVLDLNNPNHQYCILDCATPEAAAYLLKTLNAKPVAMTIFGKILCQRQ